MEGMGIAQVIRDKAYDLGYAGCGIISLERLHGYAEKLEERVRKVPESAGFYATQRRLIDPRKQFPWAKSVVVVAERYGTYKIPRELKGRIGRPYLFDGRVDAHSKEFKAGLQMESLMHSLGLKFASERKFGLVGLRWAALQAGIGRIRRNNFFYTKYGSWVTLYAWLTDQDMECTEAADLPECPTSCDRCIKACPTGSLSAPYTMSPMACVSFLTTFGGRNLPEEPLRSKFGNCIYGCDICQEVCPMNKGKWEESEEFPGLSQLAPFLTPEKIMEMDDEFYKDFVQPKFFYLKPDELWKWKVDTLCFMHNQYQEAYEPYILEACHSPHEKIREMAKSICQER
ncbi:putative Fe-S protein [Desulfosporosinus orientis DSM 765]|uniref:Putative Fe-S protein n=1 Tax=Desulfosporosinus orientis (strain ATCC 19365 / DSM 765 / NCIMB 8382 / VKM B-1628 / Singapore I) TaxID=768706 RepID=G7WAZ8_DESOD|nr:epoxyqueuosine reductase [Desulfosporosinus orientis]AET67499.1 putative Fe-S protein [Desulfosporosinus orientis DSM 765]